MRLFLLLFFLFSAFQLLAQADTTQKRTAGRKNSAEQQKKPYLILISADGFRHDYAGKYGAVHLQEKGNAQVKAAYMQPAFPSLTFPNHYTLATGLYPAHHGLVDNNFYDPSAGQGYSMSRADKVRDAQWYGGIPLWVLAEQQQMLSASFYWVGTEASVSGILPTYYYYYNEKIGIDRRIQAVVDWLQLPADVRPHFISFYFPEVDSKGHSFGPDSEQTKDAVRYVDSAVFQLSEAVKKTGLDVNFIFVSDHGMTLVDTAAPVRMPVIDTTLSVVSTGSELSHVYVKEKANVKVLYNQLKGGENGYSVYLKDGVPKRLHYGVQDDVHKRIGDIVLIPHWPRVFTAVGKKPKLGAHGFDPFLVPDMRTVFYAWGPAFKLNKQLGSINNVDVYPVVTEILGLKYQHKIDGRKKLARKILRK